MSAFLGFHLLSFPPASARPPTLSPAHVVTPMDPLSARYSRLQVGDRVARFRRNRLVVLYLSRCQCNCSCSRSHAALEHALDYPAHAIVRPSGESRPFPMLSSSPRSSLPPSLHSPPSDLSCCSPLRHAAPAPGCMHPAGSCSTRKNSSLLTSAARPSTLPAFRLRLS